MTKNVMIIGYGEIGSSVYRVEKEAGNNIKVVDPAVETPKPTIPDMKIGQYPPIDVMHICIGFSKDFITHVTYYAKEYHPKLLIINSTVEVGTTQKLRDAILDTHANHIVHSPVRGVHPELYEGLLTFVKYVGGKNEDAEKAIEHFESIKIGAQHLGSYETTELAKILSTSYYGWNILFAKEAEKICKYYGVDYDDVYTSPNLTYNEGYKRLGMGNVVRPILYPPKGEIGGHCITPNYKLLPSNNTKSKLRKIYEELNVDE